ncbi:hypothetical protein CDV31_002029 [Fusarium ambrosium]|uniref:SGNH hydrolase-type esterase domain-containing protein n=1 Tax=Fusarium ambrosium TaxID=131363 RepID=A0A428UXU7_9HYPO|nr:hypothetical protein CDV31_002029 [Fusarium ambrosium]
MRFQSTAMTPLTVLWFILVAHLSTRAYGLPETKLSGTTGEVDHYGVQIQDSPQFVMIFGDSFSRIGTQHNITRWRKPGPRASNPIGNPAWPGDTSTGGMNWIGYMVSEFNQTLTLAYGFASSGAVVDPRLVKPIPYYAYCFEKQIKHFNVSIGQRPGYAPWNADNSVVVIWFGVNDIRLSYKRKGIKKHVEKAVKRLFEFTHKLHELGLRQFVFMEVPPLEFLPLHQPRKPGMRYVTLTYAIRVWNDFLDEHIERFREDHPDSTASIVQISDIYMNAMLDPKSFGARNNRCTHRKGEKCLWYDILHPGKRIHRLMAERVAEAAWGG